MCRSFHVSDSRYIHVSENRYTSMFHQWWFDSCSYKKLLVVAINSFHTNDAYSALRVDGFLPKATHASTKPTLGFKFAYDFTTPIDSRCSELIQKPCLWMTLAIVLSIYNSTPYANSSKAGALATCRVHSTSGCRYMSAILSKISCTIAYIAFVLSSFEFSLPPCHLA